MISRQQRRSAARHSSPKPPFSTETSQGPLFYGLAWCILQVAAFVLTMGEWLLHRIIHPILKRVPQKGTTTSNNNKAAGTTVLTAYVSVAQSLRASPRALSYRDVVVVVPQQQQQQQRDSTAIVKRIALGLGMAAGVALGSCLILGIRMTMTPPNRSNHGGNPASWKQGWPFQTSVTFRQQPQRLAPPPHPLSTGHRRQAWQEIQWLAWLEQSSTTTTDLTNTLTPWSTTLRRFFRWQHRQEQQGHDGGDTDNDNITAARSVIDSMGSEFADW